MGPLTEDMLRLRQQIEDDRRSRRDLHRAIADEAVRRARHLQRWLAQQQRDRLDRAAADRAQRGEALQGIRDELADLRSALDQTRREFANERQQVAADLQGMANAWAGRRRSRRAAAATPPEQDGWSMDDLTRITGIGPARAAELSKAGIRSFSDLARASFEKLEALTGQRVRPPMFERWRQEAKSFSVQGDDS